MGNHDTESKQQTETLLNSVSGRGNQLHYMVIYLSPGDYHRFHSPAVHCVTSRRHIAGYLSPVKPSYVTKHRDVFKNNERVNLFGTWQQDLFFCQSYVGALNVGSICLDFDTSVVTNCANPPAPYFEDRLFKNGIDFKKGEMMGRFEMGSTIVLIWEQSSSHPGKVLVHEGQKINLGEPLFGLHK